MTESEGPIRYSMCAFDEDASMRTFNGLTADQTQRVARALKLGSFHRAPANGPDYWNRNAKCGSFVRTEEDGYEKTTLGRFVRENYTFADLER